MKKRNDKGFTLVELIVVLVILAILAAILVPALLGYIDKAREKQVTTNAEAAYVAAQAYWTECYGKAADKGKPSTADTIQAIKNLTDITETFDIEVDGGGKTDSSINNASRSSFIIGKFVYKQTSGNNPKKASWDPVTGDWTVTDNK